MRFFKNFIRGLSLFFRKDTWDYTADDGAKLVDGLRVTIEISLPWSVPEELLADAQDALHDAASELLSGVTGGGQFFVDRRWPEREFRCTFRVCTELRYVDHRFSY